MADLTREALEILLKKLGGEDPARSADNYFELRLKLSKCLGWKGCAPTVIDDLVDESLDRVAAKLLAGESINNLSAYSYRVLNFVWLEQSRKNKEDAFGDDAPETMVFMELPGEVDRRIECLRSCLPKIAPDEKDRRLIIGYYDSREDKNLIKRRKSLAEFLGLKMNALKVRACRLRAKLEICINECVAKRVAPVTE